MFMKATHWVLVVILCSLLTPTATAQVAPGGETNFAMIGITRGQTLQINVVAIPPDPCFAQLGFQNSSGNPGGTTPAVTLQPGESASLSINGNSLGSGAGQRVQVLPTVAPAAGIANVSGSAVQKFDI